MFSHNQESICRVIRPYTEKQKQKQNSQSALFESTLAHLQPGTNISQGSVHAAAHTDGWVDTPYCMAASVLSPPALLRPAVLQQDRAELAEEPDNSLHGTFINIQAILKKA